MIKDESTVPTFSTVKVSDPRLHYRSTLLYSVYCLQAEGGIYDRNAGSEGFHPHQSRDHRAVRVYIRRGDAPKGT